MSGLLITGAEFSSCRKYRYALWRIWDQKKPMVMFVGLNPSTADESQPDPTILSVMAIANNLGYGGFYMMNCFPYVTPYPEQLADHSYNALNDSWLYNVRKTCKDVIFCWGAFKIVRQLGRDKELMKMFPEALALKLTKDGCPWHPLYIRRNVLPVKFV